MTSEVVFFDAENIENLNVMVVNGITYENLFPLAMLQDMIQSYNEMEEKFSDEIVAKKILDYWENDA